MIPAVGLPFHGRATSPLRAQGQPPLPEAPAAPPVELGQLVLKFELQESKYTRVRGRGPPRRGPRVRSADLLTEDKAATQVSNTIVYSIP